MSTQTMTPVGTANIPVRRMDFEFDDTRASCKTDDVSNIGGI